MLYDATYILPSDSARDSLLVSVGFNQDDVRIYLMKLNWENRIQLYGADYFLRRETIIKGFQAGVFDP